MKVINGLDNVTRDPSALVTVGSFDGLHLGHQRIIQQMRKMDGTVTVVTFDPHPQMVIRPNQIPPPLLTGFAERLVLFEKISVERLIIVKFDKKFAILSPENFINKLLLGTVGIAHLFVGPRHGFGHGRKGNVKLLREYGKKHDFEVHIVDTVSRFGERISSSRIRKLLFTGDALTAWRCLGRPYYMDVKVVVGDGRGRILGFPTANLVSIEPAKLVPPPGVYATVTEVDNVRLPSVSHIGPRPTFKDAEPSIETHIIGFKGNIYHKTIRVGLVDKLRDIATFTSPQELIRQLGKDLKDSAQRLAELGFGKDARLRIQRYGKILT